jgi:uncharacterized protein (TIGR03086 family)
VTDDPLALLSRALDQAGTVVGNIDRQQATLPTPCRSWDVATLVNHIIYDLGQFSAAATGGRASWDADVPTVDGDWGATFRDGARALLEAWRQGGDLNGTVRLPIGEVPTSFVINQQVTEFAVHAWDLVRATGQRVDLDTGVAEAALEWARTALRPQFRGSEDSGKVFGPEQTVPAEAPAPDRLAAFFGRNP